MRASVRRTLLSIARLGAALPGSGLAAVACALLLSRRLPLSRDARFLIAFLSLVPLWIGGMCWAFLRASALRTWGALPLIAALAFGATKALGPLHARPAQTFQMSP